LWSKLQDTHLSEGSGDTITWKLTNDAAYSVASAYLVQFEETPASFMKEPETATHIIFQCSYSLNAFGGAYKLAWLAGLRHQPMVQLCLGSRLVVLYRVGANMRRRKGLSFLILFSAHEIWNELSTTVFLEMCQPIYPLLFFRSLEYCEGKVFFFTKGRVMSTLIFITHTHCTDTNIVPADSSLLIATETGHEDDV
jgi:hypothetical protein